MVVSHEKKPLIKTAEAHTQEESLQDLAWRVAEEEGFDPQIVFNVIDSETGKTWGCSLVGTSGELGCLQIIPKYHPNVNPLNFEASVRYFIQEYKAGRGWQWVGCSCVKTTKLLVPELSGDARDLKPNATMKEGEVAIFYYESTDTYHVFPYKVVPEGLLAPLNGNSKPCLIEHDRLFTWEEVDKNLVGFWSPSK